MKYWIWIFFLPLVATNSVRGEDPRLSPEERRELLVLLEQSAERFLGLIDGLDNAQWRYKPNPDRWSVGQVAEHILRTEASLFTTSQEALATPAEADWQTRTAGKAELLKNIMPNRTTRAQAPQEVRPRDDLSQEEVVRRFREQREEIRAFAQKTQLPVKAHIVRHPFEGFGDLNAYDWLMYVPLHTLRHTKQIAEVQADPGYPAAKTSH